MGQHRTPWWTSTAYSLYFRGFSRLIGTWLDTSFGDTLSATIVEAYPQSSENPEKAVPGTRL